jgi:hypothetical protein
VGKAGSGDVATENGASGCIGWRLDMGEEKLTL